MLALSSEWFEWYQTIFTDWMTIAGARRADGRRLDQQLDQQQGRHHPVRPDGHRRRDPHQPRGVEDGELPRRRLGRPHLRHRDRRGARDLVRERRAPATATTPCCAATASSSPARSATTATRSPTTAARRSVSAPSRRRARRRRRRRAATSSTRGRTARPSPYTCGNDLCAGYRCVVGNTISPACFTAEQCAAACAGACVDIPTASLDCSTMCAVQPPATEPPPVLPATCDNLFYSWPDGTSTALRLRRHVRRPALRDRHHDQPDLLRRRARATRRRCPDGTCVDTADGRLRRAVRPRRRARPTCTPGGARPDASGGEPEGPVPRQRRDLQEQRRLGAGRRFLAAATTRRATVSTTTATASPTTCSSPAAIRGCARTP